jgi:PST family polysaccharide transporter
MLWSYIPRRPRLQFNQHQIKPLVGFGLLVSAETLLIAIVSRLFMSVFGYLHGVEALGYLNFAVRLVDELAMVLTRIAAKFAFPLFAALERGGTPTSEAFLQANRILTYGAFPMFAGIGLVAPEFVAVLFGGQWTPSIVSIQILAAYWVLATSRFLVGPLFRASGRPSIPLYIAGLDAALSIASLIVGSAFGPVATTALWAARILVMAPLTALTLAWIGRIVIYAQLKSYLPAAAATLCMGATIVVFKSAYPAADSPSLALVLEVALGATAFVSVLLLIDRSALSLIAKRLQRSSPK